VPPLAVAPCHAGTALLSSHAVAVLPPATVAAAAVQSLLRDCRGACSNSTNGLQASHCTAACFKLIQKGCISKSATPPAGAKGRPKRRALFKSDALKAYAYVNAKAQLLTCADVAAVMGAHPNDFLTQHSPNLRKRDYALNKVRGLAQTRGGRRLRCGPPALRPAATGACVRAHGL
jgi:hypothetical protein